MKQEDLLKELLLDDLVAEKGYLTKMEVEQKTFLDPSTNKFVEVVKLAVQSKSSGDTAEKLAQKLYRFLSK